MKKRRLAFFAACLLIAFSFGACEELLDDCETCRYNVYVDGVFSYSELEGEYCGADLIAKKAAPDVTVGTTVTKFECDGK